MVELKEYQRRQIKVNMLNNIIQIVKDKGSCRVTIYFITEIFGSFNPLDREFKCFLKEYNFLASRNNDIIEISLNKKNKENMSKQKSPYTFKMLSFDGYKNGQKSSAFFVQLNRISVGISFMSKENVENALKKYPDCKELKKAIKLYKMLDKYVK